MIWKYPWTSAIHIFCSDNQVIDAAVELSNRWLHLANMNSWFSNLLIAATIYQENPDESRKLWNIV